MAFMQCPSCCKTGKYIEKTEPRQRDGAMVTKRICFQKGCGYSVNVKTVYPEPVRLDMKKQYVFTF